MDQPSRREILSAVSALGVAAMLPGVLPGCGAPDSAAEAPAGPGGTTTVITKRKSDLIRDENEKPGTKDWMLSKAAVDLSSKYRCPWIEGYFSRSSARAGETVTLHVSTNPASKFTVDLYRMGYYGGTGARLISSLGSLSTSPRRDEMPLPSAPGGLSSLRRWPRSRRVISNSPLSTCWRPCWTILTSWRQT